MEHRPRRVRPPPRDRADLDVRPGRTERRAPGARPGRHRLRRVAAPHRLSRSPARAGRCDDLRLPHRHLRGPSGRVRAVRTRRTRRQRRRDRRRALRRRPADPRVDPRRLRPPRRGANARGQPPRELGAARQLPDARRQVRVHRRGVRHELRPPVRGHGAARPRRRPAIREARRRGREHNDEINGIVAEWTATLDATEIESAASPATYRSRPPTPPPTSLRIRTSRTGATSSRSTIR